MNNPIERYAAKVLTNGSSQTLTPATSVAAGKTAFLVVHSGDDLVSSVTDSVGNTWTVDHTYKPSAGDNPSISIASCQTTTAITTSDSVTVNFPASLFVNRYYWILEGDASLTFDLAADATAASGTAMASGTTGTLASATELCWGLFNNRNSNAVGYTAGTGWSTLTTPSIDQQFVEYQIVASTSPVTATCTASRGDGTYLASVATYKASASAPTNTVAPAVTGTATVGSTLTTSNGTWSGSPTPTFTYQWQRDNAGGGTYGNISSATSSTYVLVDADDACNVRCVVTASNASGSASANSNATLIAEPVATNSVAPVVSGNANVNSTVSAATGTWAHMGGTIATYGYQWQDSSDNVTFADIVGATSSSYTIASGELSKYLRCNVKATNTGGTSAATASNSLGPVQSALVVTYRLALAAVAGRFLRMKGIR